MSLVLARIEGRLGHIVLNRPSALNALNSEMVAGVAAALDAWRNDERVACVLLTGAGERGFCAGGDIRAVHGLVSAGKFEEAAAFFRAEYRLDAKIARYPKPIIAIMDGITMGGGIGLGSHARHRVVTERSMLAMPETRIGFFPDVGATFLLSRAEGELGTHAGLTGNRLGAADAIACNLADHLVPSQKCGALREALAAGRAPDEAITGLAAPAGTSQLRAAQNWIDRCYRGDDAGAIVEALRAEGQNESVDSIAGNSPSSIKVTLQALRNARRLGTLEECLDQEFRLTMSIIRDPDFREGVRAAVIDKDRKPKWRAARLEDVSEADVARHFGPVPEGELALAA